MIYPATDQYINLAHNAVENGEVIVYPTDTLYGFGVDATNTDAVQRLNRLKGRVKPLSIVLESIEQMHDYAKFDGDLQAEMDLFFRDSIRPCSLQNRINSRPWCRMVHQRLVSEFQITFSPSH